METGDKRGGERKHALFGLTLKSAFPFASRLAPGRGVADLLFTAAEAASADCELPPPVYESPLLDASGDSLARLYRLADGELMRFGDALDFHLSGDRIDCRLNDPARRELVEIRLLGPVLAYWLERAGIPALHASAVVTEGRAVAFLAANQGGKTGLAAAMMSAGARLLTDDLLPLEALGEGFVARPGYPQMRLRPDGLAHFVGDPSRRAAAGARLGKHWLPVADERFRAEPVPLRRIYLPQRLDASSPEREILIEPVPLREAVIELVRRSFSPYIVEAVGLQPARLELFARVVRAVPVLRLRYPSGFERLPEVTERLLIDLQG